ncbi:CopG family transcriptional regulator [bacterium]|nr:CopG family transcriptional regulator [bacterium]
MKEKKIKVTIPKSLYEKIENEIQNSPDSTVSEFVIRVLKKHFSDKESEKDLSKEDEEKVKERLKALGYMD